MDDYYALLGVERSVTDEELNKVYRKIARECHPDTHPGDKIAEDRFKMISEAYNVLSDADKRSKYDANLFSTTKRGAQRRSYQEITEEKLHGKENSFWDFLKDKADEIIIGKTPLRKGLEEHITLDGIEYRIIGGKDVYMEDLLYIKFSENYKGAQLTDIPVIIRHNGRYTLSQETLTEKLVPRIQPPIEICFPGYGIAGGDYFITVEVRYPESESEHMDKVVEILKKLGE